jgi:hypothetical protein
VDKTMKKMDKVLDFGYSSNGRKMIISGVVQGQSDLYLFDVISKRMDQITDDIYDDLNPQFISGNQEIIFSSNRPSDTIFKKPEIDFIDRKNDLFIYDLKEIDRNYKYLTRVTNTPLDNEIQPYELKEGTYVYLSDQNGIYNRFIAQKDSSIAFIDTSIHYNYSISNLPQTNYVTSIREHMMTKSDDAVYLIYQNNSFKFIQTHYNDKTLPVIWNTTYRQNQLDNLAKYQSIKIGTDEPNDTIYLAEHKYQKVLVEIGNESENEMKYDSLSGDSIILKPKWKPSAYTIYQPNFAKDYVLTQFDNNFLFPNYQPYSGPGSVYFNPGMNMLLKLGASDLFDDFKLLGGMRIPTSLNSGGEFLLMAEHLKDRVDP